MTASNSPRFKRSSMTSKTEADVTVWFALSGWRNSFSAFASEIDCEAALDVCGSAVESAKLELAIVVDVS
jgi:hypothetical protein